MNQNLVLFEKDKAKGIALVTLNRPDRLNALLPVMRIAIRQAIEDVAADDDMRVLVITGNGRGFCAGADVETVATQTEWAEDETRRRILVQPVNTPRLILMVRDLPKPTITALNGVAAGAGVGLALAPDIVIASDQARLRCGFIGRGLLPGDALTYLLPRLMGTGPALEFMYTNDFMDAKTMERLGVVNRVVPHDKLMEETMALAARVAKGPPIAMALAKRAVYKGLGARDLESHLEYEHSLIWACFQTEDHKEGVRAFMEKREPVFKGK